MRKSVTNFYDVDDVKKMMKDVLRDEEVVTKNDLKQELSKYTTKDDLIGFKDTILHELQAIRDNKVC